MNKQKKTAKTEVLYGWYSKREKIFYLKQNNKQMVISSLVIYGFVVTAKTLFLKQFLRHEHEYSKKSAQGS